MNKIILLIVVIVILSIYLSFSCYENFADANYTDFGVNSRNTGDFISNTLNTNSDAIINGNLVVDRNVTSNGQNNYDSLNIKNKSSFQNNASFNKDIDINGTSTFKNATFSNIDTQNLNINNDSFNSLLDKSLVPYAKKDYLNNELNSYSTNEQLSQINNKFTSYAPNTLLQEYIQYGELSPYVQQSVLDTTLTNYTPKSALDEINNKFNNYLLNSSLTTRLSNYAPKSVLQRYAPKGSYLTNNDLTNKLSNGIIVGKDKKVCIDNNCINYDDIGKVKAMSDILPTINSANTEYMEIVYNIDTCINRMPLYYSISRLSTAPTTISLPFKLLQGQSITVDWGDGKSNTYSGPITLSTTNPINHVYDVDNQIYTVRISGKANEFGTFSNIEHYYGSHYITSINSWGKLGLTSLNGACIATKNIQKVPNNIPPTVTSVSYMFYVSDINYDINSWDVSNITDMSDMFNNAKKFNKPLDKWNTSNVTNMNAMFYGADSFNQSIGNWNTSKVGDMGIMFSYTKNFNQPINNWNTSNVYDMSYMFYYAKSFNQPIGSWNINKVNNMSYMFDNATSFNQDLSNWIINANTNVGSMFNNVKLEIKNRPKLLCLTAPASSTTSSFNCSPAWS